jgi:predicted TIM-barrel fold metal-dependent hydrolase
MAHRIDTHVHILHDDYRRALKDAGVPIPLPPWSRDMLDDLMARHEIDASVVSVSPPGVFFGDQGFANDLARMVNERTAELVADAPDRFAGLAFLPLPDVSSALDELEYALDVLGLDGVSLLSNVAGIYHGAPEWDPLWAELERRAAYVMLHPTMPPHELPLPQHPVWLYEFPFDTTRTIVNLIYSGTLERSPSVRLQVPHLGGTASFLAHRIASLEAREPEKATLAPSGALATLGRLYYDTGLSNNSAALASTLEVTDAEHVVFGTDWPYAALPAEGSDPAPGLDWLGERRTQVDGANATALVPRFASG